jgi:hypothetical protein
MPPRTKILLILCSFLLLTSITQAIVFNDPGFTSETVLTLPAFSIVDSTFAPDGRIFVWQREGIVRTYFKPTWTESGGSLPGSSSRKAIAIATPIFNGCLNCSIQTSLLTQGRPGNRVWC